MRVDNTGNVGIGTSVPRNIFHLKEGVNGSYAYIQGGTSSNSTDFGSADTIPVVSSGNGFTGYNGLAIIPKGWGAVSTTDAHNGLYIAGNQTTGGGTVAATLSFGNWDTSRARAVGREAWEMPLRKMTRSSSRFKSRI